MMRVPCKVLKVKKPWILLTAIGTILFCLNFVDVTISNQSKLFQNKIQLLHQLQPEIKVPNPIFEKDTHIEHEKGNVIDSVRQPTQVLQKEIQHIAFLKVHKAASSTAQNIFLRYGWNKQLTFVLSPAKNPFGYPNIISLRESLTNSNILPPPPNKHYDILCNHVFYTKEAFSKFMPSDTAYIGIIREPFELYKSILNYFRPRYIFKKIEGPNPASTFLRDPKKFEPKGRVSSSWTNNRMAVEFGFPESVFTVYNETIVNNYLAKLDTEFTLVMIAEYMEDSVVLMRRLLGWQTKDILFLNLNIAHKKNESMLSQTFDRDFYRRYAKVDYALYNFFYIRLRKQIREQGVDFDEELLAFKDLRKRTQEYCSQTKVVRPLFVAESRWGKSFTIGKSDCNDMRRGEINFVTMIRMRQYGSKDI
ncbi:galactose-3-O-sulfotransferase 2-like [Ruditapes philippinarum]|uniref:galactose-3-O-sulfotransferase 2-like n=1 Tax=Ruditapes philippinarum TaxID=129788 RepID=UPI00295A65B3|nr:galactose-3-O-sulfotransferase 2-like [Ruditapes philippinarum]